MLRAIFLIILWSTAVFGQTSATSKARTVALLDVTTRNSETGDGEVYSARHVLKVAGLPFIETTNIDTARKYGTILVSSKIETFTFSLAERDSFSNYVTQGGILIAPHIKDANFYPMFGINSNASASNNYKLIFNTFLGDPSFRWLDDTLEQTIILGDTSYAAVINTRSFGLNGALSLAKYDSNTDAITKYAFGSGHTYALGVTFKNIIQLNQLNRDFNSNRSYSNGFEPTSDAIILFIKGIITAHHPKSVWLHTSPYNSKSTLMITHDIDATSGYDTMRFYADYENQIGLSATYLITTHYINDGVLSDFYNVTSIPKVQYVLSQGHVLGSHSVGHFTDFDEETYFPLGVLGNTAGSYVPFNSGSSSTTGGTVLGELEVSKGLLNSNFGVNIKTFRAGHLCFNDKLGNALDTLGYAYNTTMSANDALTNFPYRIRADRANSGVLTKVWEFPMTLSDVFASNPITFANYPQKVSTWLDVVTRNKRNFAPTVLLIHPTRYYKLNAEQDLINQLPADVYVSGLETFADYWLERDSIQFTSVNKNDTITVVIPQQYLPLSNSISFIVDNGQSALLIKVQDDLGNPIAFTQSNWEVNDKILHMGNFPALSIAHQNYYAIGSNSLKFFPNPFDESTTFYSEKIYAKLNLEVFDVTGRKVAEQLNYNASTLLFNKGNLESGIYLFKLYGDKNLIGTGKGIVK